MERRKNRIVDRSLQYRYVLLATAVTIILINAGIILASFPNPLLGNETLELNEVLPIALVEAIILIGVWYIGIRLTHRVSGPLFSLRRSLQRMGDGDLMVRTRLRRGDYFHDLAGTLGQTAMALRDSVSAAQDTADALQNAAKNNEDPGPLVQRLVEQLSYFKTRED